MSLISLHQYITNGVIAMETKPVMHESYSEKSMFGQMVKEQNAKQPKYCEPGEANGEMKGEKRNTQKGA